MLASERHATAAEACAAKYGDFDPAAQVRRMAGRVGELLEQRLFDGAQGGPFGGAQGGPFDGTQGGPFGGAQGGPFGGAQGGPFDGTQGGPFGAAQGGLRRALRSPPPDLEHVASVIRYHQAHNQAAKRSRLRSVQRQT